MASSFMKVSEGFSGEASGMVFQPVRLGDQERLSGTSRFDGPRLFMLKNKELDPISQPAAKGEDGSPGSFDQREGT